MIQFSGYSIILNQTVNTTGTVIGPPADGPYPGVYCSVYNTNTTTLANIYDSNFNQRSNPFLVGIDGSFSFYGTSASYDLLFSATLPATNTAPNVIVESFPSSALPTPDPYLVGQLIRRSDDNALLMNNAGTWGTFGTGGGGGGGVAIAAGTQTATTNTIVFSNSNGITFGMSGSTRITASYTVPSTAGLLSAINISAGAASNNLSALTFSNSNGVSFGLNGSTLTATVATNYQSQGAYLTTAMQSNAVTISNINVSAGTTSNNLSAFTFNNGNGVSFGLNGSVITGSVAAAGGAQTGISGLIVSDATYTSGTVSFSNQNGVTIGSSVNGASQFIRLSVATNYQSQGAYLTTADLSANSSKYVQNWKLTGNTAGTTSSAQGTDLWLAGGNGVTVSGSSNSISFSVATNYQSQGAYLTTADLSANSSKYVQNWKLTGNTAGTTSSAQGTDLWFSGGNSITVSGNSNSIVFSVGAYLTTAMQSNAATISNINVSAGTTSNNLSAFTFSNGSGVSFGLNGSVITASVAAAGGAQTAISGMVVSDTTYTSGTVSFSNQNGVTIGSSVNGATQYIRLSVATNYQSQGAYLTTAALSGDTTKYVQNWKLTGNTAGTTSSAQGTDLWFSGGNNVTVSGNSNTIVISAAAGGGGAVTLGMSNLGNTAGTTGVVGSQLLVVGGNNITASQSINGQSATISISAPDISQLTGVAPIALSSAGSTISVSLVPVSQYDPFDVNNGLVTNSTLGQSSLFFYPFDLPFPISASRVNFFVSVATLISAAASSGSGSLGMGYALYTRGTGASSERISLLTSYSAVVISYTASSDSRYAATHYNGLSNATSHSTATTAISSSNASTYPLNSLGGFRAVALPVNLTLAPGRYWMGFSQQSTNNAAASWSIAATYMQQTQTNWIAFRPFGTSSAASNASVYGVQDGVGTYSAQSAAWPNSIGLSNSDIKMAVTAKLPYFNFSGIGTSTNLL